MRTLSILVPLCLASACTVMVESPDGVAEDPPETISDPGEQIGSINLTIPEGLDAEEQVFLAKLNEYRATNGLAALQVSVALTRAADAHAQDMATQNYFSHDSIDGTTWSARIKKFYAYSTYLAENIAAGNAGGDATFTQWKNSPGHDANMKGTNYRVIGIARAYNAAATYRWYWVTDFGGYVDEVMTPDGGGTTPPPPPPTNLLTDGGFETQALTTGVVFTSIRATGRWFVGSAQGTAALAAGSAAAGARGVRITDALTGNIAVAQLVAATPGTSYRFAAKARYVSGAAGGQIVYLDFLDASYATIGRATLSAGSGATFHDVTATRVAPTGTAFVRVALYGYTGNNDWASTYDWDEVSLTGT